MHGEHKVGMAAVICIAFLFSTIAIGVTKYQITLVERCLGRGYNLINNNCTRCPP